MDHKGLTEKSNPCFFSAMRKLIKFCFYHFYHSFAWTYDSVAAAVSVGRWRDWGGAALPYVRGPVVLETGFGPGHLQVELNRMGYRTIGLDESWPMIRQASANLRSHQMPPKLARGLAQQLPYANACFDCVLASFPTDYIVDKHCLEEIQRVLKPGGRVVVLPAAGMHRAALPDRFASWLFQITGQHADVSAGLEMRYTTIFSQAGFKVRITRAEIRQSTVMIVLAEKPI